MKLNSLFHFRSWSLGYRQDTKPNCSWYGNLDHKLELMEVGLLSVVGFSQFVDCYDSVKGSAHDYGALSLTGDYIAFRNYVGKYILFVNVATY
uniref:Uncharacterized protein n=1 Tax=Naja naja TaxID=35670 RepID=A0A8C6XYZ6_NAJNA